jgi:hypothetical protein
MKSRYLLDVRRGERYTLKFRVWRSGPQGGFTVRVVFGRPSAPRASGFIGFQGKEGVQATTRPRLETLRTNLKIVLQF